MHDDKVLKWFDRLGLERPTHEEHATEEEIRKNLKPVQVSKWYLEGNILVAETDQGTLKQAIPPHYICTGVDKKGLPTFKKLLL